jgi:hypothetical protein
VKNVVFRFQLVVLLVKGTGLGPEVAVLSQQSINVGRDLVNRGVKRARWEGIHWESFPFK